MTAPSSLGLRRQQIAFGFFVYRHQVPFEQLRGMRPAPRKPLDW